MPNEKQMRPATAEEQRALYPDGEAVFVRVPVQAAPAQVGSPRRPCRLVLLEDAGGPRYYLDGRPVHAGDMLEVLIAFGPEPQQYFPVRFEWSGRYGTRPSFCFNVQRYPAPIALAPHEACTVLPAHMTLPEGALFRRYET